MQQVIRLLKEKNSLLRNFLALTTEECVRLKGRNFNKLQAFYETREGFLKLIQMIDEKIENLSTQMKCETQTERMAVEQLLSDKDGMVASILDKDLEIIAIIENEKSAVLRDLVDTQKGRKIMKAYSNGVKTGL